MSQIKTSVCSFKEHGRGSFLRFDMLIVTVASFCEKLLILTYSAICDKVEPVLKRVPFEQLLITQDYSRKNTCGTSCLSKSDFLRQILILWKKI